MTYFNTSNKCLLKNVYGIDTKEIKAYYVGQYIDNLHLNFLKQYRPVPPDSINCSNSMDIFKII